jgi:low affinity Fe/Cu permease
MQVSVTMHRWSANRPFSRTSALAFVGLAICVFLWGLQYKLSLYDPPSAASHHIPTAKLLSKNEQSSSAEGPLAVRTKASTRVVYNVSTAVSFILLLIVCVLNPPLSGQREQLASRLWGLRRAYLRASFVRPPPVLF